MANSLTARPGGDDEPPGIAPTARVMQFVCQKDGEALVLDPGTGEMFALPAGRTYPGFWPLEPGTDVRVILAAGQPLWVVGESLRATAGAAPFLDFLLGHRDDALVVEFDDGDRYPAAALDLCGENPDGEFEIIVKFTDSIGRSHAEDAARAARSLRRTPQGTGWTSVPTPEPVSYRYTAGRVRAI